MIRPNDSPTIPRLTKEPTLKADPAIQLTLLDLQELDSRADQLRYQRGTLPEHDDLAAVTMTRKDLGDRARDQRRSHRAGGIDRVRRQQRKDEADDRGIRAEALGELRRLRDAHRHVLTLDLPGRFLAHARRAPSQVGIAHW